MAHIKILLGTGLIIGGLWLPAGCQSSSGGEPTPMSGAGAPDTAFVVDLSGDPDMVLERNADGYADITTDDLDALLAESDVFLVNTHVPFEGDITGTDASIAYDTIENQLDQLPADKAAPIVLYCRSGRMSTEAAEKLVDRGYTSVMELDGGFNAWKAEGRPFEGP